MQLKWPKPQSSKLNNLNLHTLEVVCRDKWLQIKIFVCFEATQIQIFSV